MSNAEFGKGGTDESARFGFGCNWAKYLALINDERVSAAERSLLDMLNMESLEGLRLLDAGSGSGLFSLAARNLGATVHSFDYDSESVGCTRALRERYRPGDEGWIIEQGDVLCEKYISRLGMFDVVYSWGVLHHTGNMWHALRNLLPMVSSRGLLFIAIYNDQRWLSMYWWWVKRVYNNGIMARSAIIAVHAPYFLARHAIKRLVRPAVREKRGMDPWRDILDWLGGFPFEVARPEVIHAFYREHGFVLERMTTVDGRHGCNEYVFSAPSADY